MASELNLSFNVSSELWNIQQENVSVMNVNCISYQRAYSLSDKPGDYPVRTLFVVLHNLNSKVLFVC